MDRVGLTIHSTGPAALRATASPDSMKMPTDIVCDVWPHFPSDIAPIWSAAAAGKQGRARVTDRIYDKRSAHVPGLNSMGYDVRALGNVIEIVGDDPSARETVDVIANDIRSGAALVIGAIGSNSERVNIYQSHQIKRGYSDLPGELQKIGVNIEEGIK